MIRAMIEPLTETPPPPDFIGNRDAEWVRDWHTLAGKLVASRTLAELDLVMLCLLIDAWQIYSRGLRDIARYPEPEGLRESIEEWRLHARQAASEFFLIPESRINLGIVADAGGDSELSALFRENNDESITQ